MQMLGGKVGLEQDLSNGAIFGRNIIRMYTFKFEYPTKRVEV